MEAVCLPPNLHFSLSASMNGTQRRTLVSPKRMHFMYSGIEKGTFQTEVTQAHSLSHC